MGARIAAQLANAGIPCYLLDIAPTELNAAETKKGLTLDSAAVRNRIVLAGLEAAKKSRPAALFTEETARLVTPGNFEDNLGWCGEVDWIVEAVAENLEIKRGLYARVEAVRKPRTIVTSNTSGLPIHLIAEGRSEDFQLHWAGTHFFNPPRYMKLVELIPGPKTRPEVMESLEEICDLRLGKGVVVAKDTPNFIANRIGTYAMLNVLRQMRALGMTIEEVDACTGPAIGQPKSATFRTADIVGLDVLVHVVRNIYDSIPNDESRENYRLPALLEEMMKREWLGDKTGGGFYKRVKKGGESEILTLDWQAMEYRPKKKAKFGSIEAGKGVEGFKAGDSVAAMTPAGGGYASHIVIPAATAIPFPKQLDPAIAAAVLVQGLTAYILLDQAPVKNGDVVLIAAAAGGVGGLAVQLAKAIGATVIGLASEFKFDLVKGLGADHVFDYSQPGWAAMILRSGKSAARSSIADGWAWRMRAPSPPGMPAPMPVVPTSIMTAALSSSISSNSG